MGIFLNLSADNYLVGTAGSAGAVGTGAYTIACLVRPKSGNNNCGMIQCRTASAEVRALFEDALHLFGANDFSSGYSTLTQDTWYLCAQTKPAGSNLYRFHLWAYASDGSGTMSHGTETGGANQGDGSSISVLRVGWANDRGNGDISVVGLWTSVLSDANLDSLKSNLLTAWTALSPTELITFDTWNGTTGWTTKVGTSSLSSITGSVTVGADPPSFSFSTGDTPVSDTDTLSVTEAESIAVSDSDTLSITEVESNALSETDTLTVTDAQSLTLTETEQLTVTETQSTALAEADTLSVSESESNALADVDTLAMTEVESLGLSDSDTLSITESQGSSATLADTETLSILETQLLDNGQSQPIDFVAVVGDVPTTVYVDMTQAVMRTGSTDLFL